MSAYDYLRRLKFPPHTLPFSTNGEGPVKIPGLGAFAFVSVGSTAYTTGIDIYFHPENLEEPAKGHLRFRASISHDLQMKWQLVEHSLDYGDYTGQKYGARVWEACQEQLDLISSRAPSSWGFHFSDAAEMELSKHATHHRDTNERIQHLNCMLAKETKHSLEREKIRSRIEQAEQKLLRHTEQFGARIQALKNLKSAWLNWSSSQRNVPTPIREIFEEALNSPIVIQTNELACDIAF